MGNTSYITSKLLQATGGGPWMICSEIKMRTKAYLFKFKEFNILTGLVSRYSQYDNQPLIGS